MFPAPTTLRTICYTVALTAQTALTIVGIWAYSTLQDPPVIHHAMSVPFLIGYAVVLAAVAFTVQFVLFLTARPVEQLLNLAAMMALTSVGVMGLLAGLAVGHVSGGPVFALAALYAGAVIGRRALDALLARGEGPVLEVVPDPV